MNNKVIQFSSNEQYVLNHVHDTADSVFIFLLLFDDWGGGVVHLKHAVLAHVWNDTFQVLFSNCRLGIRLRILSISNVRSPSFQISKFAFETQPKTQPKLNPNSTLRGRLSPQASWIRPRPVVSRPARAVSDFASYIISFGALWAEAHSERKKHRRYRMYVFLSSQ